MNANNKLDIEIPRKDRRIIKSWECRNSFM